MISGANYSSMKLEILICTIDERIEKASKVLMAPQHDISYLISWQQTEKNKVTEIPKELLREDVKIITLPGSGNGRNRNNLLEHASGDICLFADDDVTYEEIKVRKIFDVFNDDKSLDFATFEYVSKSHVKKYPSYSFDLRKAPHGYSIVNFEIAFRRESLQGKVYFNNLMGLGAPYLGSGEEEVFLLDVLKTGLNCRFFPLEIVRHDDLTTFDTRGGDEGVLRARGMLLRIYYPYMWFPHYAVAAFRVSRKWNIGFYKALKCMFEGYAYAKGNNMINYNIKKLRK